MIMMCDNCKLKGHTDDCVESDCAGHLERQLRDSQHENAILVDALRYISSPMYVDGPAWGMREIAAGALKQVKG